MNRTAYIPAELVNDVVYSVSPRHISFFLAAPSLLDFHSGDLSDKFTLSVLSDYDSFLSIQCVYILLANIILL